MQFKTMLSKILLTSIIAINILPSFGVSANPTSSQTNGENNPEATRIHANPDLIPPPVPTRKRKSTESTTSSTKRIKSTKSLKSHPRINLPYNVSMSIGNYFSPESNQKGSYVSINFQYKGETATDNLQLLMKTYTQMLIYQANHLYGIHLLDSTILKRAYALNDIVNSVAISFEVTRFEKTSLIRELTNLLINLCNALNIQFNNIR